MEYCTGRVHNSTVVVTCLARIVVTVAVCSDGVLDARLAPPLASLQAVECCVFLVHTT
jgi:hypothetical protein